MVWLVLNNNMEENWKLWEEKYNNREIISINNNNNMKNIFASKTIWWNLITVIVCVATFYGYTPDQALAQNVSGVMLVISPVINLILRYFTEKGIAILPK